MFEKNVLSSNHWKLISHKSKLVTLNQKLSANQIVLVPSSESDATPVWLWKNLVILLILFPYLKM